MLIFILMAVYCFKVWFVPFYDAVDVPTQEELDKVLIAFEPKVSGNEKEPEETVVLFPFDPNQINKDSLLLLGMSESLANRFLNYRSAIGAFKDLEQISKVYGLDSIVYASLVPFMTINKSTDKVDVAAAQTRASYSKNNDTIKRWEKPEPAEEKTRLVEDRVLDINAASEDVFKRVVGIGDVLAARIIKYRNLLGGFLSTRQLYEVYGLDSNQVRLEDWELKIDLQSVKRIHINVLDEKALAQHPYVSWKQAKVIVNFRKQHGDYDSIEDFEQLKVFSNSEISQLAGYLEFD